MEADPARHTLIVIDRIRDRSLGPRLEPLNGEERPHPALVGVGFAEGAVSVTTPTRRAADVRLVWRQHWKARSTWQNRGGHVNLPSRSAPLDHRTLESGGFARRRPPLLCPLDGDVPDRRVGTRTSDSSRPCDLPGQTSHLDRRRPGQTSNRSGDLKVPERGGPRMIAVPPILMEQRLDEDD
jgi:hypothetical protein